MDKKKKLGNKGFSLVELIIVIAIMVLLVGLLAPQYIKYLDKSRIAADTQLADNVRQALTTTLLDPTITTATIPTNTGGEKLATGKESNNDDGFWSNVYGVLGVDNYADLKKKLKFDSTADIYFAIDTNKNVVVSIDGGNYESKGKVITVPDNATITGTPSYTPPSP